MLASDKKYSIINGQIFGRSEYFVSKEKAKQDITKAYTQAINEAIESFEGIHC